MTTSGKRQLQVTALCFLLAAAQIANAFPQQPSRRAPEPPEDFKFTKADVELYDQVNLLDERFEREGLVYEDGATAAYVQRVGESLVLRENKQLEHVVWKFRVLRDPIPNAFALPNGSIYINSGLVALLENESQLAAILGHEVTHVLKRHTYLQNRSNRKKILAINIIEAVNSWNPLGGIAGLAIDVISTVSPLILVSTMFGYSRELEKEADLKGIDLMVSAEYPPEEMVKALKLLSNDIEGEQVKLFYNDHPQLQDRIAYVTSYLGVKAAKPTEAGELKRERAAYLKQIESTMRHDIQIATNAGRFRTAIYLSQKLVGFRPDSSENVFWQAESYRTLGPRAPELTAKELTNSAKKEAAKKHAKRTLDEEERELLATEAGRTQWRINQQRAEELYGRSLSLPNPTAESHRGLGMLYEKTQRPKEAIAEYHKYLDAAPAALDRERIKHRLQVLTGS